MTTDEFTHRSGSSSPDTSCRTAGGSDAELLAAELDAFCYAVSHDLRAPLRAIDGFSRVLEEDHAAVLGTDGLDALGRVRASAARMTGMLEALLQLARLARRDLVREPVDVTTLAGTIVARLRTRDPNRSATVSIAPHMVANADASLLRIALEHLLENAWKFTAPTHAAVVDLSAEWRDTGWIYRLRDNGAGFDMAGVDRLFAPFQRLHAESEFPGLGIGLASVRRIVHRHGGRIRAEGRPGGGATFTFTLQPDIEVS